MLTYKQRRKLEQLERSTVMITNNSKRLIYLRSGKQIERVIRRNRDGWQYVRYNGRNVAVSFYCGHWCEVYR